MAEAQKEFPVIFLHRAFRILEDRGHEDFRRYCSRVQMPSEDIARVISKYNYVQDPEYRAKVKAIIAGINEKLGGQVI